ncbi:MAG: methionine adenosyltransferase [Candidatus Levybacteria bacterium]|nr:methionine adenosyltransferase [Candidatus Levybacteria bacterium]
MAKNFTFTSESVCSGHPDKICDRISDSILDAVLAQDPAGRVAIETMAGKDRVFIVGELTSKATIAIEKIARETIRKLGYTNPLFHFTDTSPIDISVHQQSAEIAQGVDMDGAGDQGMMFGFACTQTKELMPLPIVLAHKLAKALDTARESKSLPYLRPDGKTQVTVEYKNGKPANVSHVVIAVPHDETITLRQVKRDVHNTVVKPILEEYGFFVNENNVTVNGTGVWHIGGPASDAGLTGRKIVVDTYGGYARVGGGCFSGKDPTKVDRSGAYAARYIAKNIVSHGLADEAEVRLAYCIGAKKPLMQDVETFETEKISKKALKDCAKKFLDTSVGGIIKTLDLQRPIYAKTSSYGHFGRLEFPWETVIDPS